MGVTLIGSSMPQGYRPPPVWNVRNRESIRVASRAPQTRSPVRPLLSRRPTAVGPSAVPLRVIQVGSAVADTSDGRTAVLSSRLFDAVAHPEAVPFDRRGGFPLSL